MCRYDHIILSLQSHRLTSNGVQALPPEPPEHPGKSPTIPQQEPLTPLRFASITAGILVRNVSGPSVCSGGAPHHLLFLLHGEDDGSARLGSRQDADAAVLPANHGGERPAGEPDGSGDL